MDKKYLVFVSSTYEDLKEERSAVMQVLLESDAIPTGMELFPATHDDKWELIKEVIQQCDYYVLISAGKYGSIDKNGNSFTENEYDYAISINKPVISFLYEKIDKLPGEKIESTDEGKKKLEEFRTKVSADRVCSFWTNVDNLMNKVNSSFQALKKRKPAIGWVRSDQKNPETSDLVLQLKTKNEELEKKIIDLSKSNELDLADGDDVFSIACSLFYRDYDDNSFYREDEFLSNITIDISWNDLFKLIPLEIFYKEVYISSYESEFEHYLNKKCRDLSTETKFNIMTYNKENFNIVIFQFSMLNYLISDGSKISLSGYGKKKFVELHTIRKSK